MRTTTGEEGGEGRGKGVRACGGGQRNVVAYCIRPWCSERQRQRGAEGVLSVIVNAEPISG